jgi:hypothetical protein
VRCAVQGKFYELFEMDAHVGAEVLGLMYMRVCTIKLAQSAWLSFRCILWLTVTELAVFGMVIPSRCNGHTN